MKVGDIVNQNDRFYNWWNAPKFKRKITNIKDDIIYFDDVVIIENLRGEKTQTTKSFNCDYLKIEEQYIRKNKLLRIYEQI